MDLLLKDLPLSRTKEITFYYMSNKPNYICLKKSEKDIKGF